MESVQIYLLWLACVLLRLQYEVFCFALVISIFYKCPLYPRFAEASAFEETVRGANLM